ncbi:MAG: regulatory iron-sulfur-containing complex subunit RicT [Microscillaceae bacterium]|nr:regulatory iron-sulfur-containing complex subunit RicT [Microscillaceae bacterium]
MGCSTCASGGCSTANKKTKSGVGGCKNNGVCGTGGCNKLNTFDWLSNMEIPSIDGFDIVEVRFKNGKKEFFRNTQKLDLTTGDHVVVDMQNGFHLGKVSLQGELVRLQMLRKKISDQEEIFPILRIATSKDLDKFEQTQEKNMPTMYRARQIIRELGLKMKLSDVEYQADNTKATFYYSADDRVDFRELIKLLASEFKIRVEMKQISLRQEASRLGGIGSCGRELCCSTWITEFKSVSTAAARYQNLSLNPSKLSGQCGRLKCCLNYELETYMEALKDIPTVEEPLKTKKGPAHLYKTDIFKKIMWFGYNDETIWHPIPIARVEIVVKMNKEGKVPETLLEDFFEPIETTRGSIIEKEISKKTPKNENSSANNAKNLSKNKKRKKRKPNKKINNKKS